MTLFLTFEMTRILHLLCDNQTWIILPRCGGELRLHPFSQGGINVHLFEEVHIVDPGKTCHVFQEGRSQRSGICFLGEAGREW